MSRTSRVGQKRKHDELDPIQYAEECEMHSNYMEYIGVSSPVCDKSLLVALEDTKAALLATRQELSHRTRICEGLTNNLSFALEENEIVYNHALLYLLLFFANYYSLLKWLSSASQTP